MFGYRNRGGTLEVFGRLFTNECPWAHVLSEVVEVTDYELDDLLAKDELQALRGETDLSVLRQ